MKKTYRKAFSAYGIEAEYMIVEKDTLKVVPIAEKVLTELNSGLLTDEVQIGQIAWSNELVSHVLEIKCAGPSETLLGLDEIFHESITLVNELLGRDNCMLLPGAMHPFMDPENETVLWPHGQKDIYSLYNEIFSCKGHGWANLQSVHINLPFANEEEFGKLHAAIRAVLPLIPWLAGSSPIVEGKKGTGLNNRLAFYERNQARIPSIAGQVIPEPIYTYTKYQDLLKSLYNDISPYDPEGVLAHQWLNSRGAIVKFDVQAIEIRVMDIQECPMMDFSLIEFLSCIIKDLFNTEKQDLLRGIPVEVLREIYEKAKMGEEFELPALYANLFNSSETNISQFLLGQLNRLKNSMSLKTNEGIDIILQQGNLSKRILSKLEEGLTVNQVYKEMGISLKENRPFNKP